MTQSLVPQVPQLTRQELDELVASKTALTHEDSLEYPSYQLGYVLHQTVNWMWELSEDITREGLALPFCMNSKNEDDSWNFSWGWDDEDANTSNRSCYYTIYPNGRVHCREYPSDEISLVKFFDGVNVAAVIISDLLQSNDWDKQPTATRLEKMMAELHNK